MYRLSRRILQISKLSNPNPKFRALKTGIKDPLIEEPLIGDDCSDLPPELSKKVVSLKCKSSANSGICNVVLVGTCHISSRSCDLVKAVISSLKPLVVFLELCPERVGVFTAREVKVPTVVEIVKMWSRKTPLLLIMYRYITAKVALELNVIPGNEFRVANQEATKYGAKLILGDRPVQITTRRLWDRTSLFKLVSRLIFQSNSLPDREGPNSITELLNLIEADVDLDLDQITRANQHMSKLLPPVAEILIHERDKYMSSELLRVASKHNSVVAVVGKGHLPGIKNELDAV